MSVWEWIKNHMNPSLSNLYAEYIDTKDKLDLLDKQVFTADQPQRDIVEHCRRKITELETAINRNQVSAAWRTLHRAQEEQLLLVSTAELASEGRRIIQSLLTSALSDGVKKDWIEKVEDSIKKVDNNGKIEELKARQHIRMAANFINDYTDDAFWDIWVKRLMSFIYISALAILLLVMAVSFGNTLISPCAQLTFKMVLLLGAVGGYASGVWGSSQEYFAKGYFWINMFYYALVRPVAGILAAVLMFWLLMGQTFLKVDPPLAPGQIACPYETQEEWPVISKSTSTLPAKCICPDVVSSPSTTPDTKDSIITFKVPKGMSIYPYLLLLLIAGFAGDKLLKSVTDKVMTKLFAEAEKTKELTKSA